jgi:hypothetical protein
MTQSERLLRGIFNALFALALLTYSVVSWLTGPFLRYDVLISLGFGVFFAFFAVVNTWRYFAKNGSRSAFNSNPEKPRDN